MSLREKLTKVRRGVVVGTGLTLCLLFPGCDGTVPGTYESADEWATMGAAYDLSATNPDLDPEMRNLFRAGANYSYNQSTRDFERARTERMARAAEEAARIRAQGQVDSARIQAQQQQQRQGAWVDPATQGDLRVVRIAEFKSLSLEHNVFQAGEKGMSIVTSFDVTNKQGCQLQLAAYFYNENGSKLMDSDNQYCTSDGQVGVGNKDITSPPYYATAYNDVKLFMPYNQLDLSLPEKQRYNLKLGVVLWDISSETPQKLVEKNPWINFRYGAGL